MEKEYFVQQEAFMEDYQQLAAQKDVTIESLADKIINQLNQTQEDYYEMPAEEAKGWRISPLPIFSPYLFR